MKRLFLASLTFTILCLGFVVPSVSAHVLKTDGNIGAILHINPDDNPVSGRPTSYFLYFADYTNQLELSHCNCKVMIQENGQTIASLALNVTKPLESDDSFNFAKPGVYTLEVTGQPKTDYQFQSFKLNYLVRVSGNSSSNQPFPLLIWVGLGFMMGLILLGAFAMELKG